MTCSGAETRINPPTVITGLSRARYLDTDAALQLELQADHVHLGRGAQQAQLGHLGAHLVDGHLDGAQVALVLVHDGDSLLHVRETVGGCRETALLFTSHKTHKSSSKRGDAEAGKQPRQAAAYMMALPREQNVRGYYLWR